MLDGNLRQHLFSCWGWAARRAGGCMTMRAKAVDRAARRPAGWWAGARAGLRAANVQVGVRWAAGRHLCCFRPCMLCAGFSLRFVQLATAILLVALAATLSSQLTCSRSLARSHSDHPPAGMCVCMYVHIHTYVCIRMSMYRSMSANKLSLSLSVSLALSLSLSLSVSNIHTHVLLNTHVCIYPYFI